MTKKVLIESVLIENNDGLTLERLSEIIKVNKKRTKELILDLKKQLKQNKNRGFKIIKENNKYKFYPKFKVKSTENCLKKNLKVLEEFSHTLDLRGRAESTIKYYSNFINRFLKEVDKLIKDINVKDIRQILSIAKKKGNKKSTISTKISILKSFFSWLLKEEKINKNPMNKIIKPKESNKDKIKYLTEEEVEKIRQLDMKLIDETLFELFYSSGIRVSEAKNLNWSDIDFKNNVISIRDGKGGKDRKVMFSVKAGLLLKRYKGSRKDSDDCVFRSNFKNRMSRESIYRHIKKLGDKANLSKNISPHTLRHTFATRMLNSGTEINVVQEMLGHTKVSTTQIYAQTDQSNIEHQYKKVNL